MRRAIISALAVLVGGCSFGFAGGGLPPGIKTVAVVECLNNSADPGIAQQVRVAVKQAVESRLGLRPATEAQADAIVRCSITSYEPDRPVAYVGNAASSGTAAQVTVTQRQVELNVDVSVIEQKTTRTLWDGKNVIVQGAYNPGRESDGRQKALDALIKKLIDGVQANW